jgi:hypothetical protein
MTDIERAHTKALIFLLKMGANTMVETGERYAIIRELQSLSEEE